MRDLGRQTTDHACPPRWRARWARPSAHRTEALGSHPLGSSTASPLPAHRPTACRSQQPPARGIRALAALCAAVLLAACSTDFDPYAEGPPYFALDGQFDTRADTQFVRVQDLSIPPGIAPDQLPVTVTLTDLSTGGVATLRDSLVVLNRGGTGHLFWTTAPFQSGRSYALRAQRDGEPEAVSEATLTVPEAGVQSFPSDTVSITRELVLNGVLVRRAPIAVVFGARRTDTNQDATVTVSPLASTGTSEIQVSLATAALRIRFALGLPEPDSLNRAALTRATVTYLAESPEPSFPTNGRGQITWIAELTAGWRVPPEVLRRVGLQDGQDG